MVKKPSGAIPPTQRRDGSTVIQFQHQLRLDPKLALETNARTTEESKPRPEVERLAKLGKKINHTTKKVEMKG